MSSTSAYLKETLTRFNSAKEVSKVDDSTLVERHGKDYVSIYVETGSDVFTDWNAQAERARREASLAYDSVIGWWTRDPSKPRVADADFLVAYVAETKGFIPYVSITKGNAHDFRKAAISALSLVGEATISLKRTGKAPEDPHIWYRHGSQALDDLIQRGTRGIC